MPVSLTEAVTALSTTLHGFLPIAADLALAPELFVTPIRSQFAGIGGIIGTRRDAPTGDVMVLKVTAEAVVRVKAPTLAQLAAAEANVTISLLGADPVHLRSNGVFRIRRITERDDQQLTDAGDLARQDIRFEVLYEFKKLPETAEGVISSIPIDLLQRTASARPASQLLLVDCEQDPLGLFDVVDDAGLNEPGQWQFAAAEREIRQTSTAGGGSNSFNASKRGTYLLVKPSVTPPAPRDFVLYTSIRSDSSGGVGLIFRFQDIDNFYYVLLHDNGNPNAPFRYRIIGRKLAGNLSFLESGGADQAEGYVPGTWFSMRLAAQDQQFDLAIDGVDVLSGHDSAISTPGRIGLMARTDAGARFRFLHWVGL